MVRKRELSDQVVEFIIVSANDDFESLTIKQIIQKFNVSRSHLFQTFKSEKPFSLGDFILREKMYRAASLLEEDEALTVKDLSEKMGFCNADYFIQTFKRYFGITPGRYREVKNGYFKLKT